MTTNEQAQIDSRREAIIEAAARLFSEKGFGGASNRDIAREASISPGLIYWYFTDKDELFLAVMEHLFPLQGLEMPENSSDLPLEDLLHSIASQVLDIMTQPNVQRLMRLALTELIRFPQLRQGLGEMIYRQGLVRLASDLDSRVARGELPPIDTHLAAQTFFGSLVGFVLRKHLFESFDLQDTSNEAMVRTVVRIHAAGLKSPAGPDGESGGSQ